MSVILVSGLNVVKRFPIKSFKSMENVASQFPDAVGLEFIDKDDDTPTAVNTIDGTFDPPEGGWFKEDRMYRCVFPAVRRERSMSLETPAGSPACSTEGR